MTSRIIQSSWRSGGRSGPLEIHIFQEGQPKPQPSLPEDITPYKRQWPFIEEFEHLAGVVQNMLKSRKDQDYGSSFDEMPGDRVSLSTIVECLCYFQLFFRNLTLMTALVNDLATGRKHLERTGGDQIIPPVLRARSSDAWLRSKESRISRDATIDMTYQARAYAFEHKWFAPIVASWQQAAERFRARFPHLDLPSAEC